MVREVQGPPDVEGIADVDLTSGTKTFLDIAQGVVSNPTSRANPELILQM